MRQVSTHEVNGYGIHIDKVLNGPYWVSLTVNGRIVLQQRYDSRKVAYTAASLIATRVEGTAQLHTSRFA